MQKIQFVTDPKELEASGVDVTIVSLGDTLRPASVAPGQCAIAVGARGGSMWQLISRPFPSREEAKAAIQGGFELISTEVAVRWARSLLVMGVATTPERSSLQEPYVVRVTGKPRQLRDLEEAYAKAESLFGRLGVGNPPGESSPPSFETTPVEGAQAKGYQNWFEERFGIKRSAIKCNLTKIAALIGRR